MTEKRKPGRPRNHPRKQDIEKIEWVQNNSFQPKTNDVTEYDAFVNPFRPWRDLTKQISFHDYL